MTGPSAGTTEGDPLSTAPHPAPTPPSPEGQASLQDLSGPPRPGSRRPAVVAAVVVGVLLLGTTVAWAGGRYAGASLDVTGPVWECTGTSLTDATDIRDPDPFADPVDEAERLLAPRRVPVLREGSDCWGTWTVANAGVLPLEVERFELPLGGPVSGSLSVADVRVDGGDVVPLGAGPGVRDFTLGVETAAPVGRTLRPGEAVEVALHVLPSRRGCVAAGSSLSMSPTLAVSLGPVPARRTYLGERAQPDPFLDDPSLALVVEEDLGRCPVSD